MFILSILTYGWIVIFFSLSWLLGDVLIGYYKS